MSDRSRTRSFPTVVIVEDEITINNRLSTNLDSVVEKRKPTVIDATKSNLTAHQWLQLLRSVRSFTTLPSELANFPSVSFDDLDHTYEWTRLSNGVQGAVYRLDDRRTKSVLAMKVMPLHRTAYDIGGFLCELAVSYQLGAFPSNVYCAEGLPCYYHAAVCKDFRSTEPLTALHKNSKDIVEEYGIIFMRYFSGRPLSSITKNEIFEYSTALEITRALIELVAYMHSKGIRHSDLHMGNVLADTSMCQRIPPSQYEIHPKAGDVGVMPQSVLRKKPSLCVIDLGYGCMDLVENPMNWPDIYMCTTRRQAVPPGVNVDKWHGVFHSSNDVIKLVKSLGVLANFAGRPFIYINFLVGRLTKVRDNNRLLIRKTYLFFELEKAWNSKDVDLLMLMSAFDPPCDLDDPYWSFYSNYHTDGTKAQPCIPPFLESTDGVEVQKSVLAWYVREQKVATRILNTITGDAKSNVYIICTLPASVSNYWASECLQTLRTVIEKLAVCNTEKTDSFLFLPRVLYSSLCVVKGRWCAMYGITGSTYWCNLPGFLPSELPFIGLQIFVILLHIHLHDCRIRHDLIKQGVYSMTLFDIYPWEGRHRVRLAQLHVVAPGAKWANMVEVAQDLSKKFDSETYQLTLAKMKATKGEEDKLRDLMEEIKKELGFAQWMYNTTF